MDLKVISPTIGICLVFLVIETITGLASNIFIIFSLILSGYKEKCFPPITKILIALCFSSMSYTFLLAANILMSVVCPLSFNVPYILYIISYTTFYSINSSAWLTCSLCLFYFIKIIQFKPGFFAWVKMRIEAIVPWMILTVEILSLSVSFLSLLTYTYQESTHNSTKSADIISEYDNLRLKFMATILMTCALPLLIAIFAMAASALFLKRHSHHINKNVRESQAGVKDYRRTVQTMSCLIIFYALLFIFMLIFSLPILDYESWEYWVSLVVLFSFALVQSSLLIAGNPKLKEAWRQMFTCT